MENVNPIPLTTREIWQKLCLPATLRWLFLALVVSSAYGLWAHERIWLLPAGGFDILMILMAIDQIWFLDP
jgi:hypothetical protein